MTNVPETEGPKSQPRVRREYKEALGLSGLAFLTYGIIVGLFDGGVGTPAGFLLCVFIYALGMSAGGWIERAWAKERKNEH